MGHGLRLGGVLMPLPQRARAAVSRLKSLRPVLREREIVAWTGIGSAQWRELARRFPALPADPGPRAARARRTLSGFAERALSSGRWAPRWEGSEPPREPAIYVTAHLGSLLSLRYTLRARGVSAASVIAPYNFDRPDPAAKDARFDRQFPLPHPHVVSSSATHSLRSLLRRGSLILAADLPAPASHPAAESGFRAVVLGGEVGLDERPFRLARLAGVSCRPVFLTLPDRRWTLTLGEPLPRAEAEAARAFGRAFAAAASRAPLDLDGLVYRNRVEPPA